MKKNRKYINSLEESSQKALFLTSYLPLFILIILKQIYTNATYLSYGEITLKSIICLIENFGLSIMLIILTAYGIIGTFFTFKNLEKVATNGFPVKVTNVKNKNSESINYIATYIIPFAFQNFNSWLELVSTILIIYVIYRIYINSNLLLINPTLSFWFGIYDIEYSESDKTKNGIIITKEKYLIEEENIRLYDIGHKMYYAIKN